MSSNKKPTAQFAQMQALQITAHYSINIPLEGFGDLLGKDGNIEEKHSYKINYNGGNWGASLSALRKGDFDSI